MYLHRSEDKAGRSSVIVLMPMWEFLKRKIGASNEVLIGSSIIVILVIIAISASLIAPHNPYAIDLTNRFADPTWEYPLGTDSMGRCLLSTILYGLRLSLFIASVVLCANVTLGVALGLVSGYFGGIIDHVLSRIVDLNLVFPDIILSLVIIGMMGPTIPNLILALSLFGWAKYSRVIRSIVISVKEKEFVEGARSIGADEIYIIMRHILPNSIAPIIPMATLGLGAMVLNVGGLSFIGLGVEPGTPELGMLVKNGYEVFPSHIQMVLIPSLLIAALTTGFTILGDGLRDRLDPRQLSIPS